MPSPSRRTRRKAQPMRPPAEYYATPYGRPAEARVENRPWEPEEDTALLNAVERHGPKWKVIVTELGGRTEAMCRNRYQRIRAPLNGAPSRNRCTFCGELKRGHTCWAKQNLVVGGGDAVVNPPGLRTVAPTAPSRPLLPPNLLLPTVPARPGGSGGFHVAPVSAVPSSGREAAISSALWGTCALAVNDEAMQEEEGAPDEAAGPEDEANEADGAEADDDGVSAHYPSVSPTPTCSFEGDDDTPAPASQGSQTSSPAVDDECPVPSASDGGRGLSAPPPPVQVERLGYPASLAPPPRPSRLAHSFDLHSILSRKPAGEDDGGAMILPLDAVIEAVASAAEAEPVSSQESTSQESISAACAAYAMPAPEPTPERLEAAAMLHRLPSWSRAPSFSCF